MRSFLSTAVVWGCNHLPWEASQNWALAVGEDQELQVCVSLTCVDLHAGFLAHVSQLDNYVVFPSWFQFLYGVLHRAVPAFHFVDFICFPHQIFNCHGIELEGEETDGKKKSHFLAEFQLKSGKTVDRAGKICFKPRLSFTESLGSKILSLSLNLCPKSAFTDTENAVSGTDEAGGKPQVVFLGESQGCNTKLCPVRVSSSAGKV